MLPVPFQMVLGSIFAYYAKANIPLATALAWITNPLTMWPIWYGGYRFGTWVLSTPKLNTAVENIPAGSEQWFENVFPLIWQPFFFGNIILGLLIGLIFYFLITYAHLIKWIKRLVSPSHNQP